MPYTIAHELSRRHSLNDSEKLAPVLADAQLDLTPHQLDAALFAFRSPLSKDSILADEVGLGKTIEAGLVISQKWAEKNKLNINPSHLFLGERGTNTYHFLTIARI